MTIILDTEIQKPVGLGTTFTWEDTDKLGLACAVVYDVSSDDYEVYTEQDQTELITRIVMADRVVTYNGWRFDFPLIFGRSARSAVTELQGKSVDILRAIWRTQGLDADAFEPRSHGGWSLDTVCRNTLGLSKIGNGALAPLLYMQGEWGKLLSYCIRDVKLTRQLYQHILEGGDIVGRRKILKVNLELQ